LAKAGSHVELRVRGCSSMVEQQPSKLMTRVRFPSPAPINRFESAANDVADARENSFGGERNSRRPKLRHHAIIAVVVLTLSATAAAAEPLPVPKPPGPGGSCPHGYISSGSFCTPSQGAQDAIAKPPNGTCPWGWISSGSFCLRSGRRY